VLGFYRLLTAAGSKAIQTVLFGIGDILAGISQILDSAPRLLASNIFLKASGVAAILSGLAGFVLAAGFFPVTMAWTVFWLTLGSFVTGLISAAIDSSHGVA
jgi:hypothetical protein